MSKITEYARQFEAQAAAERRAQAAAEAKAERLKRQARARKRAQAKRTPTAPPAPKDSPEKVAALRELDRLIGVRKQKNAERAYAEYGLCAGDICRTLNLDHRTFDTLRKQGVFGTTVGMGNYSDAAVRRYIESNF